MDNIKKIQTNIQPALELIKGKKISMLQALSQLSDMDEENVLSNLGVLFQYVVIDSPHDIPENPAFNLISYQDQLKLNTYISFRHDNSLLAVINDPFDHQLISSIKLRLKLPVEIALTTNKIIKEVLQNNEKELNLFDDITSVSDSDSNLSLNITLQSISEDLSPIVKTVNSILYQGYREGASDIHLESYQNFMVLRYRMDGILIEINRMKGEKTAQQIISRLKVLAELDITEQRIPQDGRLQVTIKDRPVNFRISVMPNIYGEDAVLRILDKKSFTESINSLSLEGLGLDLDSMTKIRNLSKKPYGMMLMTGPTGSGKTTTLYAVISEIYDGTDKIVTIEDPVEYQLEGILQIPVNEKKGLTFAKGLRSILRHDPDKILVGEIRDHATAEIAIQSALTGHSVFSTVHANNPFDVIGRFSYMGIDIFNFVSALNGVVAQRLVRLICKKCKEESVVTPSIEHKDIDINTFYQGKGCEFCHNTGYHGRRAVSEILILDDTIREMITQREPIHRIRSFALAHGTVDFKKQLIQMVLSGETSYPEYLRHTI